MKRSTALHPQPRPWSLSSNHVFFLCVLLLVGLTLVSLCIGSFPLDLFALGKDDMQRRVFFNLRLPRVLAAVITGGVLGVTGAVCQTVFCNPLASPDITGVASGASFGAAFAILTTSSMVLRMGFAFVGGVAALALLLFFVRLSGKAGAEEKGRYLLSGILVSAAAEAGLMLLKTAADPERELAAIEFWTMGSFAAMTAQRFLWMTLASLPPVVLLVLFAKQSQLLSFGREEATVFGLSVRFWQPFLLLLCALSVAGVVSIVGVIGFVGLIVPHIALSLLKTRSKWYLPLCFVIGAGLTVLSDLFARTVVPGAELPVGIFTVGLAVVWFFCLFCRGKVFGGDNL